MKNSVLGNFAKFIGKHLCQSLFFDKVTFLRPATLLTETLAQMLSCEFCEVSKNTFFTEDLRKTTSDLNSLEPSEFEPKTNIGGINSSSSDDEEEGAEYKTDK